MPTNQDSRWWVLLRTTRNLHSRTLMSNAHPTRKIPVFLDFPKFWLCPKQGFWRVRRVFISEGLSTKRNGHNWARTSDLHDVNVAL